MPIGSLCMPIPGMSDGQFCRTRCPLCTQGRHCSCRLCEYHVLHVQGGGNPQVGEAAWQADCVLLLWLSQLLLIPFDLATVDSSMAQSAQDCRCFCMLQRLICASTFSRALY